MEQYQTLKKLSEKVYSVSSMNSIEEIDYVIRNFFDEILSRKRNDPYEEGLQASGVIGFDKAAIKINERNGNATHAHTYETLAQYLNGDNRFSTEESIGKNIFSKRNIPTSWLNVENNGIGIRLLIGEEQLTMIFSSKLSIFSDFQLDFVSSLLKYTKLHLERHDWKISAINFVTPNINVISEEYPSEIEAIDDIENVINDMKNSRKK